MWFIIAIISLFLFSIAAVADKFALTKSPLKPSSYAFFICFLGGIISSILIFFEPNFYFPKEYWVFLFLGGAGFYVAVYLMYAAILKNEVSRVNPLINSLTPIFIYLFSLIWFIESLSILKIIGAGLVILGGYILSQAGKEKTRLHPKVLILVILSALIFGISYAGTKIAYQHLSFLNAFIWIRWFSLGAAILGSTILWQWKNIFFQQEENLPKKISKYIKHYLKTWGGRLLNHQKEEVKNPWLIVLFGQTAGALATLLFQYAINLGSVTIVTALQGIQYLFLLLMTIFLSKKFPQILKESLDKKTIQQKVFSCLILIFGLVLILI